MSIDATQWAWKQPIPSHLKIILLSLADYADKDGYCYPSIKRLEIDCSMTRRTVQKNLVELEKLDLIEKKERFTKHGQTSNDYLLKGVSSRTNVRDEPRRKAASPATPPRVTSDTPPASPVTPRTNKEPTVNNHNNHAPNEQAEHTESKTLSLSFFSASENKKAVALLAQLTPEQQTLAIEIYNEQAKQGIESFLRTPWIYWQGLIKIGKRNELQPPKKALINHVSVGKDFKEAKAERIQKIKETMKKWKRESVIIDIEKNGYAKSKSLGNITKDELKEAGFYKGDNQ